MPFVSSIRGNYRNPKSNSDVSIHDRFKITGGDEVYTVGGYTIHMFTNVGPSQLTIEPVGNMPEKAIALAGTTLTAEVLAVAGGGAGGSRHGGGGGAGGMIVSAASILSVGNYPTFVGAGGARFTADALSPSGQNSTFGSAIALGGGGGSAWGGGLGQSPGGSGSGGTQANGVVGGNATQPVSPGLSNSQGFGFPGGTCYYDGPLLGGGGGGGAGGGGGNASGPKAGNGGSGRANSILGTNYFWAGGGGGGTWNGTIGGDGGAGGGGGGAGGTSGIGGTGSLNSGQTPPSYGPTATGTFGGDAGTNTGSGGGGCNQTPSTGGAGGPGIIVVRYRSS
jgi:hypothetical protein